MVLSQWDKRFIHANCGDSIRLKLNHQAVSLTVLIIEGCHNSPLLKKLISQIHRSVYIIFHFFSAILLILCPLMDFQVLNQIFGLWTKLQQGKTVGPLQVPPGMPYLRNEKRLRFRLGFDLIASCSAAMCIAPVVMTIDK